MAGEATFVGGGEFPILRGVPHGLVEEAWDLHPGSTAHWLCALDKFLYLSEPQFHGL